MTEPPPPWARPAAVGLGVALLLPSALGAAFHCDEANVFRHVTEFAHGDFSDPGRPGLLWLVLSPLVRLDPVAAALSMRLCAVLASAATLWGVGRITERLAGARASIAAVLVLATSLSFQKHGFEVRTDTFVMPLTVSAMLLLWRREPSVRAAVAAGLCVGAAGLLSQKSLYNGIALGVGCLVYWRGIRVRPALAAAGAAGALVGLWYLGLGALAGGGDAVSTHLGAAAANAFDDVRPLRTNLRAWSLVAGDSRLVYLGAAGGAVVAVGHARRGRTDLLAAAAVAALLGATVFVHRGFFRYFIASFDPYLAILAGAGIAAGLRRLPPARARAAVGVLIALAVAPSAVGYQRVVGTSNAEQLRIMRDVHALADRPVPVWDSVGLVPGHRETTFFGTGFNRTSVRSREGDTAFIDRARRERPMVFVRTYLSRDRYLKREERRWLRRHYVPYAPNVYLRGGRVRAKAGEGRTRTIELIADGPYTVHVVAGEAAVDGRPVRSGDVVQLSGAEVRLTVRGDDEPGDAWLLWGADRVPYADHPDDLVDWSLFTTLSRSRFQQYDVPDDRADLLTQPTDPQVTDWADRRRRHRAWQRAFDRGKRRAE